MSVSSSISSLQRASEPHTLTAAFDGSSLQTTKLTGDREGGLFRPNNEMGKMQFLQLLTTQLQYQDPLSPMENTEFVAQLAMFSQLESTSSMEAAMQRMAQTFEASMDLQTFNAQSTTNAASVSLVGQHVRLRQNVFEYSGGNQIMNFQAHLGEDRERAVVNIVDKDGNVVRSINLTDKDDKNVVKFTWDGRNERGERVPADDYNLIIEGQEKNSSLYCFVEDVVAGIRYTNQGTMVLIRGMEIPVSNILEVRSTGSGSSGSGSGGGGSDMTMAQAFAMIGHNIKTNVDKLTYKPEPNGQLSFNLDLGGAKEATILIKDKDGNIVSQQIISQSGPVVLDKKSFGSSDEYSVEVSSAGNSAFMFQEGKVTGVIDRNGRPMLRVGGALVNPADVVEMSMGSNNSTNTDNLTMAQALGMVGYNAQASIERMTYRPASGEQLTLNLDLRGTFSAELLIRDRSGNVVDRVLVTQSDLVDGKYKLDKKTYPGNSTEYSVEINQSFNKEPFLYMDGKITGVVNNNGFPQLKMNDLVINPWNIISLTAV